MINIEKPEVAMPGFFTFIVIAVNLICYHTKKTARGRLNGSI